MITNQDQIMHGWYKDLCENQAAYIKVLEARPVGSCVINKAEVVEKLDSMLWKNPNTQDKISHNSAIQQAIVYVEQMNE